MNLIAALLFLLTNQSAIEKIHWHENQITIHYNTALDATQLRETNIENNLAQMTPLGATYGQFTRANAYDVAPGVSGNPILIAAPARAWYWIEVFRYQKTICGTIGACRSNVNAPDALQPYVFRITAIAQGLKLDTNGNPTTRVVLKSIFVPSIDPP